MIPPMQTVLQNHKIDSFSANTSVDGEDQDMGIYVALLAAFSMHIFGKDSLVVVPTTNLPPSRRIPKYQPTK